MKTNELTKISRIVEQIVLCSHNEQPHNVGSKLCFQKFSTNKLEKIVLMYIIDCVIYYMYTLYVCVCVCVCYKLTEKTRI